MSVIVVRRRHGMRLAGARRLADQMAERLRDRFGGSYAWRGDALYFVRTGACGVVAVTARDVEIRLELGLLLSPLRSPIEREIHSFLAERLAPSGTAADGQARPAAVRKGRTRSSRSQGRSRSLRPK
jgi:putative polyhydroxyalkanoate system protein